MKRFFRRSLTGFTLIDVMMGVVLTSVMLFLMSGFVSDVLFFQQRLAQYRQLRSDLFRITHDVFPQVLTSATGVDYSNSDQQILRLFTDPYELTSLAFVHESGRLGLMKNDERLSLHGESVVVESLEWSIPDHPATEGRARLQDLRALTPLIHFRIQARSASERLDVPVRLSYEGAVALGGNTLSSYRHFL